MYIPDGQDYPLVTGKNYNCGLNMHRAMARPVNNPKG